MDTWNDRRERLAGLLNEVADREGKHTSPTEDVDLVRVSNPAPRERMVYQPKILIVGQGKKRCFLGGKVYTYNPLNHLALSTLQANPARPLMTHEGYNASTAAHAVGYESPSQFSREFKRLFGVTPVEDAELTRARLVSG